MAEREREPNANLVQALVKQPIILLACGSFNPVTNMHLRMFEVARDTLHQTGRFRVISGIISPVSNNYAKKDLISVHHRVEILNCALSTSNWIRLDTWESEQDTWIESVYVLRRQRDNARAASIVNENKVVASVDSIQNSPARKKRIVISPSMMTTNQETSFITSDESSNLNVMFLCGADVFEKLTIPEIWKPEHIEEILRDFGIVVCNRGEINIEKIIYENDILTKYKNNIYIMRDWITNDISSTKVRRSLKRGESIKYLVQDSVIDYIKLHKLYEVSDSKLFNN